MEGTIKRILIAKPGLDGHDRGAKVVAQALRDAGYEVIYTGLRHTPDEIVKIALEEDVRVIGLSLLSGAHKHLCPKVANLLKEKKAGDIFILVGGIIPEQDIAFLKENGIKEVFTPGTPTSAIIEYIRSIA